MAQHLLFVLHRMLCLTAYFFVFKPLDAGPHRMLFFPLLMGTLLEHTSMLLRAMQELGN